MIKYINTNEGYRGFFRGSSLSIAKNVLGFTSFFGNLENLQKKVETNNRPFNYFRI